MFDNPRYIQNIFNVVFPRRIHIRRLANEFEDMLKGHYIQPQIMPIPDELDFEVPRIVFDSVHGDSRILISQVSISLDITYSPDWQKNITKGKEYVVNHIPIIYNLIERVLKIKPCFCGLTTLVRLPSRKNDREILSLLSQLFLKTQAVSSTHEIQVKVTKISSGEFFSNIIIQNYRTQKIDTPQQDILPAPYKDISEVGIQVTGDYNDRYAFNEREDYYSNKEKASEIIGRGLTAVQEALHQILEGELS